MENEQQYWINQDGVQAGPLTLEQLASMALRPTAYVWRAGMADWAPITSMEELRGIVPAASVPAVPTPEGAEVPLMPGGEVPSAPMMPAAGATPAAGQPAGPCPPTNLVWAVIATLFCCIPFGIVAIYYSSKVSSCHYAGDMAAAEHYSEVSAWWCIAAIIAGIISQPLMLAFML